ncbi:hypothetical protein EYF80_058601 [Liparis tanakae]|uniref:Secreted protein n=1 Tax=Liparis tanakae TaxID=230148 RepID=A0A4Z2EQY9_9TELE|nr:hypothetical protein EYF80_058601 [Liparis tanakae]
MRPILAFSTRETLLLATLWFSTRPSTNSQSTPVAVAGSMTRMTASTLMGASRLEYWDTTLEHSDVVALLSSVSRSLSCTGRLMPVSTSTPFSTAFWKDSEMVVGWIPDRRDNAETSLEQASSRAPAITTTEVVPSPASMSWALDSSTS